MTCLDLFRQAAGLIRSAARLARSVPTCLSELAERVNWAEDNESMEWAKQSRGEREDQIHLLKLLLYLQDSHRKPYYTTSPHHYASDTSRFLFHVKEHRWRPIALISAPRLAYVATYNKQANVATPSHGSAVRPIVFSCSVVL